MNCSIFFWGAWADKVHYLLLIGLLFCIFIVQGLVLDVLFGFAFDILLTGLVK